MPADFLGYTTWPGQAFDNLMLIVQGIAADLLHRPLDFTYPVAVVLHTILLVPMPGAPAAKPAIKPASKVPAEKGSAVKPSGSVSGRSDAKKSK